MAAKEKAVVVCKKLEGQVGKLGEVACVHHQLKAKRAVGGATSFRGLAPEACEAIGEELPQQKPAELEAVVGDATFAAEEDVAKLTHGHVGAGDDFVEVQEGSAVGGAAGDFAIVEVDVERLPGWILGRRTRQMKLHGVRLLRHSRPPVGACAVQPISSYRRGQRA